MDLKNFQLSLPFHDPVLIFATVLVIVLLSPMLLTRLKIPQIVGLIIAGVIFGPHGFHLLAYDDSFTLFGRVGLLYILFLVSLEIDMQDLRKDRKKGVMFGLYTFFIPMALGLLSGVFILNLPIASSLLLGTMFASHTLLAYPVTIRFGVSKTRSAHIAVVGTIVTVILSLLILGGVSAVQKIPFEKWLGIKMVVSLLVTLPLVLFAFPYITHRFFLKYDDNVLQFIFVLGLVFLGAYSADIAGFDAVLGAFTVGLVLNRYIPKISPLMNRIKFVGNALFIPFFVIGIGMLIDVRIFFRSYEPWLAAGVMIVLATAGKWVAAWLTQKTFRLQNEERNLLFGLTNARAVVTLAIVFIGYRLPLNNGGHLLNENVLAGAVLMIFVTGFISTLTVEKASRLLAEMEMAVTKVRQKGPQKILIPIATNQNIDFLVELAVMIKEPRSKTPLIAMSVMDEEDAPEKLKECKKLLLRVEKLVAATDHKVQTLIRHDMNVANGIIHAAKENRVSEVIMGLHRRNTFTERFFGSQTDALLAGFHKTLVIFNSVQPLSTIQRIRVTVPPRAELEIGFEIWVEHIRSLSKQIGAEIVFYAEEKTNEQIKETIQNLGKGLSASYRSYTHCEELTDFAQTLRPNDLLIIITARKGSISSHSFYERLPYELSNNVQSNSSIVIYPEQRYGNGVL